MDYIEFDEEELKNPNELAQKLLKNAGENDPSSIYYKRKLVRPKFNWLYLIFSSVIFIVFILILFILMTNFGKNRIWIFTILFAELFLYGALFLKKAIIGLIHLYQQFAPESVRMKCRFEPSCSEYMKLSIEKYGIYKGILNGINRFKRCKPDNGGYDFP